MVNVPDGSVATGNDASGSFTPFASVYFAVSVFVWPGLIGKAHEFNSLPNNEEDLRVPVGLVAMQKAFQFPNFFEKFFDDVLCDTGHTY